MQAKIAKAINAETTSQTRIQVKRENKYSLLLITLIVLLHYYCCITRLVKWMYIHLLARTIADGYGDRGLLSESPPSVNPIRTTDSTAIMFFIHVIIIIMYYILVYILNLYLKNGLVPSGLVPVS